MTVPTSGFARFPERVSPVPSPVATGEGQGEGVLPIAATPGRDRARALTLTLSRARERGTGGGAVDCERQGDSADSSLQESVALLDLGTIPYRDALALQRRLADARVAGQEPDRLLLLEHPPVLTLGRRGGWDDILVPAERLVELGIEVVETNRGGLVTYHGPGQLVGYPICDLRGLAGDAPSYVTGLEETIIRALAEQGIRGFRDPAGRGVWTGGGKIAAIGVAVSRGVTMHGFAVNLQPDLNHFALINPCGLGERGVTSAERLLGRSVDLVDFRRAVAFHFGRVFQRTVRPSADSPTW